MSDRFAENRTDVLKPGARLPWWAFTDEDPQPTEAQQRPRTKREMATAAGEAMGKIMSPPTAEDIRRFFAGPQQDAESMPEWTRQLIQDETLYRRAAREAARAQRQDVRDLRNAAQQARRERNQQPLYETEERKAAGLFSRLAGLLPDRWKSPELRRAQETAEQFLEATEDSRPVWTGATPWKSGSRVPFGAQAAPDAKAPLSIRSNNPGALRTGGGWEAEVGQTANGFSIFRSPEEGFEAVFENMESYYVRHGIRTIDDLLARWAPDSENNLARYRANVKQVLAAFGAETEQFNPRHMHQAVALAIAIATHEAQDSFPWTKETLIDGMKRAHILEGGARTTALYGKASIEDLARTLDIRNGRVTLNGRTLNVRTTPSGRTEAG